MDTFARALLAAQAIIEDGRIDEFKTQRYAGWDTGLGKSMLEGGETLESMAEKAMEIGEPKRHSGRQEMLENILTSYL